MVKVKKRPDVEYRCILGRHWVAVPVVGWHCGGRLTGREREERDRQRWWKAGALLSRLLYSAAVLFCVILCCALFSVVVLCCVAVCCKPQAGCCVVLYNSAVRALKQVAPRNSIQLRRHR